MDPLSDTYLEPSYDLGAVSWECSEPDGGPDVGICIGLGDGKMIRVGEISKDLHADGGEDVAALGNDFGWWLCVYGVGDSLPLAKFASAEAAREFMDAMEAALRPTNPKAARAAGVS